MFCGIFDGHGPWGHFVAKRVRELMPLTLLCNWQEAMVEVSLDTEFDLEFDKRFNLWKDSYLKACASVDRELEQYRRIDSFYSGTTGLTIVRQVMRKVLQYCDLRCCISPYSLLKLSLKF